MFFWAPVFLCPKAVTAVKPGLDQPLIKMKDLDYKTLFILFLINRDVSRDYLGIVVFFGRVTKREAEGIAALQSSNNIKCYNKIYTF